MRTGRWPAFGTVRAFPLRRRVNVLRGRAAPPRTAARRRGRPRGRARGQRSCAAAMSTGPRRLERADRVDPAGGEMAEREGERAHDAQPVSEVDDRRGPLGDRATVRVASKERISISSFGRTAPSGRPFSQRSLAASRGPLLTGSEVVDEAEVDVAHRRPVGDRDREREEGDAALRVERAVDRVDDDVASSRLPGRRPPRRRSSRRSPANRARITLLGGRIDRRRFVSAHSPADNRFSLGPAGQLEQDAAHVVDRGSAEREPVSQAGGRADPTSAWERSTCSSAASCRRAAQPPTRPRCVWAGAGTRPLRRRGRRLRPRPPRCDVYVTPCGAIRSTMSTSSPSPASSSYRPSR